MIERLPLKVKVIGTIASISSVDSDSHERVANDSQVITMLNAVVDELSIGFVELWLSDMMIQEFGFTPLMFTGNVLHVIADQHLAGITTYVDQASGEIKAHTQDGLVVTRMYNATDDDMDQMGVSDRAYNRICNRRDELELAFKATSKDSRKDRFSLSKTSTSPIDVRIENLRKELVKEGNSKARIDAINKAINALLDQKVSEESVAESSVAESSVADQIATLELALASATTAAAKKKIQDKIDAITATV